MKNKQPRRFLNRRGHSVKELVSHWRGSAKASPVQGEVAKIFDFRRRGCSEKHTFAKNARDLGPFLYNPPGTVTS